MKKSLSIIAIVLATAALANATYADSTQRTESDGVTIVETQVEYPHSTHPNDDTEDEHPHSTLPNDDTEDEHPHSTLPNDDTEDEHTEDEHTHSTLLNDDTESEQTQPMQPCTPAHNPLPKREMPDVSHNAGDVGDEEEFTYVKFNYNPLPQDVIDFLLGNGDATDTVLQFVDTYTWVCDNCKNFKEHRPLDMPSFDEEHEQRRAERFVKNLPHRCAEAASQYLHIQLAEAKMSLYTLQNLFADAKRYGMDIDATLARDVDILLEDLKDVYDEAHLIMDQDRILWDAFWDVFDTYFDVFYLDHDIRDYEYTLRNPIPKK